MEGTKLINKSQITQELDGEWTLPPVGTTGSVHSEETFLKVDTDGSKVKQVSYKAPDSGWELQGWISQEWVQIKTTPEQEWYRSENDGNNYFTLQNSGKFLNQDRQNTLTLQGNASFNHPIKYSKHVKRCKCKIITGHG